MMTFGKRDSTDWVDRGGLTFVNELTLECFLLAMQLEISSHLQACKPANVVSETVPAVENNVFDQW